MSSPRLGVVRASMRTNPLLIKAPLGQTQSRGFSLPPPDFTYGISSPSADGGVAEALSSWRVQSAPVRRQAVRNFVSLNQDAARSGLVTAKEVSKYRAQRGGTSHTATSEPTSSPQKGKRARGPVVPDITHGITTRVSPSPFSDLLSHRYGRRWIEEQQHRNQTNNWGKKQRIKPGCIPDTRTSLLRRTRAQTHTHTHTDTHTAVTLPCFTRVRPSLDTFRTEEDRCRALRARH